jgi:predicted nuclease with TOPRIM domain
MIDVAQLINDSMERQRLTEENLSLRFKLSQTKEHLQEVEADYITRNAQLAKRLSELNGEKEKLVQDKETTIQTLTRTMKEADRLAHQKYAKLEEKIQELEVVQKNMEGALFRFLIAHNI